MNLVIALGVLGASALAAWAGLADPPGGAFGALGAVLRGEQLPARKTPPTAAGLINSAGQFVNSSGPGGDAGTTSPLVGNRAAVVDQARAQLGKPYRWAGNGPDVFDCSGLTVWCFKRGAGKQLPRTAAQQQMSPLGTNVAVAQAQPGDLIFYGFPASHVAIYIGNGQVIHAPRTGKPVKISTVKEAGGIPVNSARDFLSTPLR